MSCAHVFGLCPLAHWLPVVRLKTNDDDDGDAVSGGEKRCSFLCFLGISWRLNGRVRFAWSSSPILSWPLTPLWELELGLPSVLSPFTPTCASLSAGRFVYFAAWRSLYACQSPIWSISFLTLNCRHLVQLTNCVLIAVLNGTARISALFSSCSFVAANGLLMGAANTTT